MTDKSERKWVFGTIDGWEWISTTNPAGPGAQAQGNVQAVVMSHKKSPEYLVSTDKVVWCREWEFG